jgi:dTDP-4-amino-4,6-dideoxygalactose transaminase
LLRLPLALKDGAWGALKRRTASADSRSLTPASSDSGFDFDPWWLDKRSSHFSAAMLRLASRERIVGGRRRHYQRLQQALGVLPGCRPLHAALPDGACPWQFPLWCADPEAVFARLADAGVPVVRFGHALAPELDAAAGAEAIALSQHVLGIPCHQELEPAELDWIIAQVRAAVTK